MKFKNIKSLLCLGLVLVFCFAFAGCGSVEEEVDTVRDDLIKYVQTDLPGIKTNESQAIERYNEVSAGINDMSRKDILSAFNDEIIPAYTNFYNDLMAISPETDEVKALKDEYAEGVKKQLDGITALADAIKSNDSDAATAANDQIVEGKTEIEKHRSDIVSLAEEHNINVNYEDTTVSDTTEDTTEVEDVEEEVKSTEAQE